MTKQQAEVELLNPDGTAVLSDGRLVKLIAGRNNAFGFREVKDDGLDQEGVTVAPTLRSLGLDQV